MSIAPMALSRVGRVRLAKRSSEENKSCETKYQQQEPYKLHPIYAVKAAGTDQMAYTAAANPSTPQIIRTTASFIVIAYST